MKRALLAMVAAGLVASAASASNIDIRVQKLGGGGVVNVRVGGTVEYQIVGELTDNVNEGLALIGLSLDFTGGDIGEAADEPAANPMLNFDIPAGITNPAGYGGTMIGGDLVQIGGAQNTIKNVDTAPFPTGTVITGVAALGSPVIIATGSFVLPGTAVPGSYQLSAFDVFANVIKDGETGEVFWATEAAGVGAMTSLTVNVGDVCTAAVTSTIPPHTTVGQYSGFLTNSTLWRTLRHVIRIDFDEPAGCPALTAPTAGQILIREMLANGAFGPDLSASFTYTIEAGNVLRIREPSTTATVLADNKWYAISNNNWPGVGTFEVQWPVNTGDFDGNRFTTPTDVSGINGTPTGVVPDQARQDVNGDGFRTPTDVSAANGAQGPPPAKPTGH